MKWTREPILTADEFPLTDGSTACIPLIAQIMADTTGMDLETAQSCVSTNTTAWAWRNLSLYGGNEGDSTKLIIAYEAPESVKEEMAAEGGPLDQKAIGRDALVFLVNEENPVQSLSQQQLRDIYAGKITNWKDVGGADLPIVAFQRREDSGSQTLFQKLLIQGGELMDAPTELAPHGDGRAGGQHCRIQQHRQRHWLLGVLLHRPDVLQTRPAAAGCGRRDPLQRDHRRPELPALQ